MWLHVGYKYGCHGCVCSVWVMLYTFLFRNWWVGVIALGYSAGVIKFLCVACVQLGIGGIAVSLLGIMCSGCCTLGSAGLRVCGCIAVSTGTLGDGVFSCCSVGLCSTGTLGSCVLVMGWKADVFDVCMPVCGDSTCCGIGLCIGSTCGLDSARQSSAHKQKQLTSYQICRVHP